MGDRGLGCFVFGRKKIIIIGCKSEFFDGCEIFILCVLACLVYNLEM